jgi:hypothetical protein
MWQDIVLPQELPCGNQKLGQFTSISHGHAANNDADEVDQSPKSATTEGDQLQPPVGIAHQETVDSESAQKEADKDHGDFRLQGFLFGHLISSFFEVLTLCGFLHPRL